MAKKSAKKPAKKLAAKRIVAKKKPATKKPAPAKKKARKRGAKSVTPAVMGRPTLYSSQVADAIVDWIYQDYTLRQICALPNMPDKSTIMRWLAKHEDFRDHYARAHEIRAFSMEEEVNEIADDSSNDYMERVLKDGTTELVPNEEVISRSRLRIDTKKWLMGIKAPKRYGKQVAITGKDGGPLKHEHSTAESLIGEIDGAGTGLPPHVAEKADR
ncbi:MAG: hypothetical protein ABIY56_00050 [Dokdonella sp.]